MSGEAWLRAERYFASAQTLLQIGDAESAVSRAYYSAFTLVQTLLDQVGASPRTHKGAHLLFSQHFVKTGLVSTESATALKQAWQAREAVDYAGDSPEMDAALAAQIVADVGELLLTLRALLDA